MAGNPQPDARRRKPALNGLQNPQSEPPHPGGQLPATDGVTHLVFVTPHMGLLLMTPRVHRQKGAHVRSPSPLTETQTPPGARESAPSPRRETRWPERYAANYLP